MIARLVVLTDRSQLTLGRGLVRTVRECAAAGLEAVVVREHDLEPHARHALVAELAGIHGLTVVSSRIPDPAADGLHLAADQPRPDTVGVQVTSRSCHTTAEVVAASGEGAAWVTLSPYAASASKPGHGPPLAPGALAGHDLPVLALGGVDPRSASAAVAAGAHGVAVMGAVMRAPDPAGVVAELLAALG